MWESPITEAVNEIVGQMEKDEGLIKALNYDRKQYEKGCKDAGEDLNEEIKELKKQIEIRTQEIVTYRAFTMLVMDMKKYGRLIDKEKAFDYIMEQCSKNFNGSGEVK
jgi:hypothetical protein